MKTIIEAMPLNGVHVIPSGDNTCDSDILLIEGERNYLVYLWNRSYFVGVKGTIEITDDDVTFIKDLIANTKYAADAAFKIRQKFYEVVEA